jgi:hypothetical protein
MSVFDAAADTLPLSDADLASFSFAGAFTSLFAMGQ